MITKLGIKMDGGALNRLVQILDEDCNGEITKKEFDFALNLYNCNSEKANTN
jgi:Ca2+-binding EF-hand superfamily protein